MRTKKIINIFYQSTRETTIQEAAILINKKLLPLTSWYWTYKPFCCTLAISTLRPWWRFFWSHEHNWAL